MPAPSWCGHFCFVGQGRKDIVRETNTHAAIDDLQRTIFRGMAVTLRDVVPNWYQDAKFGIFIHWGIYSVPAFGNEWYPRNMYLRGTPEFEHHVKTYGPQSRFGFKDFIPLFKAERFEPAAWATLFRKAGARFVVPVAEHHDGFAMYKTALSKWNAAKMGPKRGFSRRNRGSDSEGGARLRALLPSRGALVVLWVRAGICV